MNRIDSGTRRIGPRATGLLACAVLLVSACAPDSPGTVAEPQATERGEQAFNENCGVCHGTDGRGPALAELKALSSAERRDRIRNHPIAGQIPQRLPAHQLSDVIEFLESE
jgi:mono/diheme cytochrome c family protein